MNFNMYAYDQVFSSDMYDISLDDDASPMYCVNRVTFYTEQPLVTLLFRLWSPKSDTFDILSVVTIYPRLTTIGENDFGNIA